MGDQFSPIPIAAPVTTSAFDCFLFDNLRVRFRSRALAGLVDAGWEVSAGVSRVGGAELSPLGKRLPRTRGRRN